MVSSTIGYDPSSQALLHPASRQTVFGRGIRDAGDLDAVCAESSRLAYLRFEDRANPQDRIALSQALDAVGISDLACFSDDVSSTEAFAAVLPGGAGTLVAFRGTDPERATNLATDLDAILEKWTAGGRVHAGFAHAFARIRPAIDTWISTHRRGQDSLVVTGHSLGAALATLGAETWKADRLVTFGSPRVGDDAFITLLAKVQIQRYVGCCDVVTRVPPKFPGRFSDTSPCLYIDSYGTLTSGWSAAQVEADRSSARDRYLVNSAWVRGNVITRDLSDHAPINYIRALVH